ncbi:MAG TPA: hypothetical protein VG713_09555 [Pirellulales bacterium]|nr:hypothetical protein [Pirellulales bacterium]
MSRRAKPTERRAEALWQGLAANFEPPEFPLTAPPGFADRVLQQAAVRSRRWRVPDERQQQRLVSMAAGFALAASIVVGLWSWQDLQAAWSPPATLFEAVIPILEPEDDLEIVD